MKTKHFSPVSFLCCLLLPFVGLAQEYLYSNISILNPQQQWDRTYATIESFTITARPAGIYTEVGIYMTIADESDHFPTGMQLEAVMNFTLPEEVIVNDSWLWIGDTIIKAKILDRWTASGIYEDIVDRRQDPSILFKNSRTEHELRIYPLLADSSRRIKINLLMPTAWTSESVLTALPLYFMKASGFRPKQAELRVWTDDVWETPLSLPNEKPFENIIHPSFGDYYRLDLLPFYEKNTLDLSFKAPLKDGVFIQNFEKDNQQFYQMAMLPKEVFQFEQDRSDDLIVMIQYNPTYSNSGIQENYLRIIQEQLKRSLDPKDRWTVILAGDQAKVLSEQWLSGSDQTIDSLFNQVSSNQIGVYNLSGLMSAGIAYAQQQNASPKMMLFANSGQEGDINTANAIIANLQEKMGDEPYPFYINNLQDRNWQRYSSPTQSYYGNEYLYTNLSQLTGGSYRGLRTCCETAESNTESLFKAALSRFGTMDLYTSVQDGFCFNRYNLGDNTELVDFEEPILQVGRYNGSFPFVIEAAGELDGQVYLEAISIPANEIYPGDENTRYSWAGQFIQNLEGDGYAHSQEVIQEIIRKSLHERVLSFYTAFLCLEPNQGGEPCPNCKDETRDEVVGTEEFFQDSLFQVVFSPNPFVEQLNIDIQFRKAQNPDDFTYTIFNMLGQRVWSFQDIPNAQSKHIKLSWKGLSQEGKNIPSGMYFFRIQNSQMQKSWKVLKR